MAGHLSFTQEDHLRLKKLLESAESLLIHQAESSLSFQVIRKKLKEFIFPLSPLSKTKELIDKILSLTGNQSLDLEKRSEVTSILKELKQISGSEQVRFSEKEPLHEQSTEMS